MANFRLDNDNIFYDIKSGSATIIGDSYGDSKSYAVVVRGGHCGNGYYIPIILTIYAKNKETAIKMAENIGRVKKTSKHAVLAIEEISTLQHFALEYINDCDPYFNNNYNAEALPDIYDRRVVVKTAVEHDIKHDSKKKGELAEMRKPNYSRIPKELVKTADKYEEKHVLQRYVAPRLYGEKLVFPTKLNLKNILDEYLHQNLYELGVRQLKASAVSFYYQLFGLNNKANIVYKDKCLIFTDENGKKRYIKVPEAMIPHLAKAKKKFKEQEEIKLAEEINARQVEESPNITLESPRVKFNKRYAKYQKLFNSNVKE